MKGLKSRQFLAFNNIGEAAADLLISRPRVSPGPLKISIRPQIGELPLSAVPTVTKIRRAKPQ